MRLMLPCLLVILFATAGICAQDIDLQTLITKARHGDAQAMCDLGKAYFHGNGTLKDPFKAKCWIKKAYDLGSRQAEKLWDDLELWRYSGKCEDDFDDEPLPRHIGGDEFREPFTGLEFIFIPRGCYRMGCHEFAKKCGKDEYPSHRVCLDGFWMGKYEVSQEQWKRVMNHNPSRFSAHPDQPVENVSFDDIQKFIRILNTRTKKRFSLPTEAQWEYACRNGGKEIAFPFDNDFQPPDENCGTCNSGKFQGTTAPVGSFLPNDIGLYDMGGNVREWCQDLYDTDAYAEHAVNNPVYDKKGRARVVRGGSFSDNTLKLRCAGRDKSIPGMAADNIGFRLVLEATE